jgi:hypothetical protein
MDTLINKLERQARSRRDYIEGHWDGYCSGFSSMPGTEEGYRDDVRRRERMAEAMYDV